MVVRRRRAPSALTSLHVGERRAPDTAHPAPPSTATSSASSAPQASSSATVRRTLRRQPSILPACQGGCSSCLCAADSKLLDILRLQHADDYFAGDLAGNRSDDLQLRHHHLGFMHLCWHDGLYRRRRASLGTMLMWHALSAATSVLERSRHHMPRQQFRHGAVMDPIHRRHENRDGNRHTVSHSVTPTLTESIHSVTPTVTESINAVIPPSISVTRRLSTPSRPQSTPSVTATVRPFVDAVSQCRPPRLQPESSASTCLPLTERSARGLRPRPATASSARPPPSKVEKCSAHGEGEAAIRRRGGSRVTTRWEWRTQVESAAEA